MAHSTNTPRDRQFASLYRHIVEKDHLPFSTLLPAARIEAALKAHDRRFRDCLWTPVLTLWTFLSQVSGADKSCRAAVARVLAWLLGQGKEPCSAQTDPYCKARKRLPESLPKHLAVAVGQELHQQVPEAWLWNGRKVKLVDGTTAAMPDTPENQAEYPQPRSQAPGLGFPIARMVVIFCLACGAVLEGAIGPDRGKKTGENALFRGLWDCLAEGDVVLGDRYFCSYFDLAMLKERNIDSVFRMHQRRHCDFRRGRRLGREDHRVTWTRPKRPDWMDEPTYASVPESLEIRELRVKVTQKGFRTREVLLATTLLDVTAFPKADLATLYRSRWHAELDIRALKTTLGMELLRCQEPSMVRKEIWTHLLAYNLVRQVMVEAAQAHEVQPRELSFKGAVQTINAFTELLLWAEPEERERYWEALLEAVASHRVGDRPDRCEPRARKRRPKQYPLLTKPRGDARKALLKAS